MSKEIQTELPGIFESDIADLVAGARMACNGGSNEFIERVFAEADWFRELREAREAGIQTRVE